MKRTATTTTTNAEPQTVVHWRLRVITAATAGKLEKIIIIVFIFIFIAHTYIHTPSHLTVLFLNALCAVRAAATPPPIQWSAALNINFALISL